MAAALNERRSNLDLIQIASPCTANWDEMLGDERTRHCGDCKLNVYNISNMTRDEAEAFLAEREGRVCLAFFRRHDGTIITRDCPRGLAAVRAKFVRLSLATLGLCFAFTATALAAVGKVPGIRPFVSQGMVSHLRNQHRPTFALGGCCLPPPLIMPIPTSVNSAGINAAPLDIAE